MKTNCRSQLESVLEPLHCNELAREAGFWRRKPKKLWPLAFLQSCCLLLQEKKVSYRRWALLIGALSNQTYSKQSLFERMTYRAVGFVQRVLLALIGRLNLGLQRALPGCLDFFKRVIIEDSTLLTLSAALARLFPGARNQRGGHRGMIRLQALYELKQERFLHFSHGAYVDNDYTVARNILSFLRAGDLLLRDLGYLVLGVLREIDRRGAYFVSRFKHPLSVFEPGGRPIDLVELLSDRTRPLDQDILVGAKEQLPVRLVGFRVSEEVANLRRHRARSNHGCRVSAKHLALLGWDLFITNVSRQILSALQVAKVYGLRFRIETLFKAWKSHFNLRDIPAGSRSQIETLLYARLLLITIFQVCFLAHWGWQLQAPSTPALSVLKLAAFVALYLPVTLLWELQPHLEDALAKQVPYHCRYEKRCKRKNFVERLKLT